MLAFAGVVLIDVLQGMIIGLVTSMLFVVYRSSRPHISTLGRSPDVPGFYADLVRHPENIPVPGVLIVRLDGQLYYANAPMYSDHVQAMIEESEASLRAVIFDSSAWYQLDLTSTDILKKLVQELRGEQIDVYFAEVHVPVLEYGRKMGLLELIGEDHVFRTVEGAVNCIENDQERKIHSTALAVK